MKILLILVSLLGAARITIQGFQHLLVLDKGDVLAIISGAIFSLTYVSRKWHSNLLNNQEITVLIFVFGALSSFLFSVVHGDGLPRHWSWELFGAVLIAGLANVINLFLTNYGFERVRNVLAGNILTLEALFAIILGYTIYGELLSIRELIGGIFIVVSVIAMSKQKTD